MLRYISVSTCLNAGKLDTERDTGYDFAITSYLCYKVIGLQAGAGACCICRALLSVHVFFVKHCSHCLLICRALLLLRAVFTGHCSQCLLYALGIALIACCIYKAVLSLAVCAGHCSHYLLYLQSIALIA